MRRLAGLLIVVAAACLMPAAVFARDISAGPIWNNADAQRKCPAVCSAAGGAWNGNWRTVNPGVNSVCDCQMGGGGGRDFNAGPIWNNQHADSVCPAICVSHDRIWRGEWMTTVPGRMSVCTCYRR